VYPREDIKLLKKEEIQPSYQYQLELHLRTILFVIYYMVYKLQSVDRQTGTILNKINSFDNEIYALIGIYTLPFTKNTTDSYIHS